MTTHQSIMDATPTYEWADDVEEAARRLAGQIDRTKIDKHQTKLLYRIHQQLVQLCEDVEL